MIPPRRPMTVIAPSLRTAPADAPAFGRRSRLPLRWRLRRIAQVAGTTVVQRIDVHQHWAGATHLHWGLRFPTMVGSAPKTGRSDPAAVPARYRPAQSVTQMVRTSKPRENPRHPAAVRFRTPLAGAQMTVQHMLHQHFASTADRYFHSYHRTLRHFSPMAILPAAGGDVRPAIARPATLRLADRNAARPARRSGQSPRAESRTGSPRRAASPAPAPQVWRARAVPAQNAAASADLLRTVHETHVERRFVAAAVPPAPPPAPATTHLVDEVLRRLERQTRAERLRRGV